MLAYEEAGKLVKGLVDGTVSSHIFSLHSDDGTSLTAGRARTSASGRCEVFAHVRICEKVRDCHGCGEWCCVSVRRLATSQHVGPA